FHDRQTVFHFLSKLLGDIFRESIWFLRLLVKLFFRYFSKKMLAYPFFDYLKPDYSFRYNGSYKGTAVLTASIFTTPAYNT
ncbi:MAG: hypothetical protein LBB61_00910, partial [Treponema sp.]|nr:hypothetical protein [Treponema sp.]